MASDCCYATKVMFTETDEIKTLTSEAVYSNRQKTYGRVDPGLALDQTLWFERLCSASRVFQHTVTVVSV